MRPFLTAFYQPAASFDTVWFFIGSPWSVLAAYLVLINLGAFGVFGLDKWKAKRPGARRIPERNLFLSALAGGSLGALLGMKVFHHKTLHRSFRRGIPAILIAQLVLAGGLWVYWNFIRI